MSLHECSLILFDIRIRIPFDDKIISISMGKGTMTTQFQLLQNIRKQVS